MNPIQGIANYFRTSKAELEKVSWPTRKQTIRYSALVIGATIVLALFFAAVDLGLQKIVEGVLIRRTTTPVTETQGTTPVTTSPTETPAVTPIEVTTEGEGGIINVQASPVKN